MSASGGTDIAAHVRENLDVLVFAAVFAFLVYDSYSYHEVTRQFPLTFLVLGLLFLVMEFSIDLLPERYARWLRTVTAGLTEDIEEDLEEVTGEEDEGEDRSVRSPAFRRSLFLLAALLAMIYLVGFLFAAVAFVFLASHLVGTGNRRHATIMAAFIAVLVYGVFGGLFNVPIFEAVIDVTEYAPWLRP